MIKTSIYYVPEKNRKYYYASNGEYDANMEPYIVNDYTLWADLNALDTITTPATVLVTELKGAKSYMYRVKFKSDIPDIFEKAEQRDGNGISEYVFFVPSDRFLRFESANHCVPVPENNWEEYSFRFHSLAAFYRLNVIPSLSMPLFEREDLFSNVCEDFYRMYHVDPPLNTALSTIFYQVFDALDFFGFLTPANLSEKYSIDAARKLADSFNNQQWGTVATKAKSGKKKPSKKNSKSRSRRNSDTADLVGSSDDDETENETEIDESSNNNNNNDDDSSIENLRSFAFAEIKFAIQRYHDCCFPWRASKYGLPSDVLDYTSFCNLTNAIQKVRRSLISLRMLPTDASSMRETLSAGVARFQESCGIPVGPCDLFTMRRLWSATSNGECDVLALCRLCGMNTKSPEVPVYNHTLGELRVFDSKSETEAGKQMEKIEAAFNEAFARVRDRSEVQQLMMDEAQKSVQRQISRVEKAESFAADISVEVGIIEERLKAARKTGMEAETMFDEANGALDEIIDEHENITKQFALMKKRINQERNGNKILFFLNIILLIVIVYRMIQAFK